MSEQIPRPREVAPQAHKAAEAICVKAMAYSAQDRYATVADLSRDIDLLLDGEPVSAYRENLFERLGRWFGKNRFLILLVIAYLLMRIFFILASRR